MRFYSSLFLSRVLRLCACLTLVLGQAYAATTKALRFGTQSVTLTSDKRSAPALAVQMPEGDIWYGFLASGTAPGRLTVQMPSGDNFSLIAPPPRYNFSFSTIQEDFPQVYTWNGAQHGLPNAYHGRIGIYNFGGQGWDATITALNIYPTYWLQGICSTTSGAHMITGNPVYAGPNVGSVCWCRLKRRSDNANGQWVLAGFFSNASECASRCPDGCAEGVVHTAAFRSLVLASFTNP